MISIHFFKYSREFSSNIKFNIHIVVGKIPTYSKELEWDEDGFYTSAIPRPLLYFHAYGNGKFTYCEIRSMGDINTPQNHHRCKNYIKPSVWYTFVNREYIITAEAIMVLCCKRVGGVKSITRTKLQITTKYALVSPVVAHTNFPLQSKDTQLPLS